MRQSSTIRQTESSRTGSIGPLPVRLAERLDAGFRHLEPVDWVFAMLRAASVLMVGPWAVFRPELSPMDRILLASILLAFSIYSIAISLVAVMRPGRTFKLFQWSMAVDVLFVSAIVYATGGFSSLFFIGYYVLVPVYALYFGFRAGVTSYLLAMVTYVVPSAPSIPGVSALELLLKTGSLAAVLLIIGFLRRRQALMAERLRRLAEEAEEKNRLLAHKTLAERKRLQELYSLNKVGKLITSSLDTHELIDILTSVSTELHFKYFCLWLYDETSNKLVAKAVHGIPAEVIDAIKVDPGEGVAGTCFSENTPVLVPKLAAVPSFTFFDNRLPELKSSMCVPITIRMQCVAVLSVYSDFEDSFSDETLEVLQAVGDQVAIALDNSRLYGEMRYLTMQDGLTHLYNRRFFNEQIEIECQKAKVGRDSFALLIIDVDHFKKVNDEFGHLVGDDVLRKVAQVLMAKTRQSDFVCRYGGEEFAVILHNLDKKHANERAERLRQAIKDDVTAGDREGDSRSVTISIGAALCRSGMTPEQVINKADRALYAAKEGGRNRVEFAN